MHHRIRYRNTQARWKERPEARRRWQTHSYPEWVDPWKTEFILDVMKYTVGGIASEVLKPFVDNLTGLIDKFNNLDPSMQKNIVKWVGIAAAAGPVLLIGGRLFKMAGSLVGTFGKVGKAIGNIGKKTKGMSAPLKEGSSVMSAAAKNAFGFGIGFAAAAAGVWILVKAAKELAAAGPGAQIATVLMAGGIIALIAVAAQLAPKLQAGTQGLLAFGGAILMAGAGMSLMAMAATQVAAAGPMAFASLALMEGGIIALLAVAGAMGPQLAGASAGLLAFGGAVLMAAAGMSLMAMAATQVAAAGPMAIAALTIMEVGMIAMMAVAGALGPALTAASVGLIAFGASIVLAATGCLIMVQAATQIASLPAVFRKLTADSCTSNHSRRFKDHTGHKERKHHRGRNHQSHQG